MINSIRKLSIVASLIISLLSSLLVFYSLRQQKTLFIEYWVFSFLLVFTISYLLLYYLVHTFMVTKLKPVFETINSVVIAENELFDKIERNDDSFEINKEVVEWVNNMKLEIDKLKESENLRKEFVGNLAHELKTPLFNIQGYVLTLLEGGLQDDSINTYYLERADKNINRLISTIEDLDKITRLESGYIKPEYEVFDIVELLHEVAELMELKLKQYNITLKLSIGEYEQLMVFADRKKIFEVMNNLIINSLTYGKNGGSTLVSIEKMLNKVWIVVMDNGIGISKANLPLIFKRFYRVDKSRSRERGGTGLGLSIVKHIVEAHNQEIKVESVEGEGTTFRFSLRYPPI